MCRIAWIQQIPLGGTNGVLIFGVCSIARINPIPRGNTPGGIRIFERAELRRLSKFHLDIQLGGGYLFSRVRDIARLKPIPLENAPGALILRPCGVVWIQQIPRGETNGGYLFFEFVLLLALSRYIINKLCFEAKAAL